MYLSDVHLLRLPIDNDRDKIKPSVEEPNTDTHRARHTETRTHTQTEEHRGTQGPAQTRTQEHTHTVTNSKTGRTQRKTEGLVRKPGSLLLFFVWVDYFSFEILNGLETNVNYLKRKHKHIINIFNLKEGGG